MLLLLHSSVFSPLPVPARSVCTHVTSLLPLHPALSSLTAYDAVRHCLESALPRIGLFLFVAAQSQLHAVQAFSISRRNVPYYIRTYVHRLATKWSLVCKNLMHGPAWLLLNITGPLFSPSLYSGAKKGTRLGRVIEFCMKFKRWQNF